MPADAASIRRRAIERAMLACYELIDGFRKELAALDAMSKRPANTEAQRAGTGPTGAQS